MNDDQVVDESMVEEASGEPEESVQPIDIGNEPVAEIPGVTDHTDGLEAPLEASSESVEQILDQELSTAPVYEEAPLENLEGNTAEAGALETSPTVFLQIHLEGQESRKAELKKALADSGVTISDEELHTPRPVLPGLQEFFAVLVLQNLARAGFSASATMQWAGEAPQFVDAASYASEGAVAQNLPRDAKEVLIVSANDLPGFTVSQSMGLVSAHKSLSKRFFKEQELQENVEKELQKMYRRTIIATPKSALEKLIRELSSELQRQALQLGGNAVYGVRLEFYPESQHLDPSLDQMRFVAIGTACVVEN